MSVRGKTHAKDTHLVEIAHNTSVYANYEILHLAIMSSYKVL